MELWPKSRAKAAAQVSAFLTRRPDLLHVMPPEGDPNRGKAWPSPRSWEMAIWSLASAEIHALDETDRDILGSGCVGLSAWVEFTTYLATLDLPDPASLLDGKINWAPDTRRLDIVAVTLSACVALVTPKACDNRANRALALWVLLDQAGNAGARDLTVDPSIKLMQAGLLSGNVANRVLSEGRISGLQAAIQGTK